MFGLGWVWDVLSGRSTSSQTAPLLPASSSPDWAAVLPAERVVSQVEEVPHAEEVSVASADSADSLGPIADFLESNSKLAGASALRALGAMIGSSRHDFPWQVIDAINALVELGQPEMADVVAEARSELNRMESRSRHDTWYSGD